MNAILNKRTTQVISVAILALALVLLLAEPSFAQSLADQAQDGVDAVSGGSTPAPNLADTIKDVVNFLLFAIGVLSVIMIIFGGLRYVVSGGDANATKSARDTILYAVIGLVVAFVAYGIVNFVTGIFTS